MRKGNRPGDLQDRNLGVLLNIIRRSDNITRQDLVEQSGLSPAGVSNLVSNLIAKELVIEGDLVTRSKGRRGIGMKLNEESIFAIGVRLARSYVRVGVFNINGGLMLSSLEPVGGLTVRETMEVIKTQISYVMETSGIELWRFAGIGISAPGPLLAREGKIALVSNSPGWRSISVSNIIEDEFGIPTYIEHDANVSALAEYWFGKAGEASNLVYVVVEQGVGAGILKNGVIFTGSQNVAGEIGHTTIEHDGPQCECGNRGCLEMYCSSLALTEKAQALVSGANLDGWPKASEITVDTVFALANEGDRSAIQLLEKSGYYMGVGVANVINAFNPDMIVLGDQMAQAPKIWLEAVRQTVKDRTIPELFEKTAIELSELEIDAGFLGTGTLVISKAFEKPSQIRNNTEEQHSL